MENVTFALLYSIFSKARLETYCTPTDTPQQVLQKYQDNILISQSMLPALHYLEICLRNRLDEAFKIFLRKDWLINLPKELLISPKDHQKIKDIAEKFQREHKRKPTHDDILSQMTFGFWCAFFHKKYDPIIWHRKSILKSTFPNLSRSERKRSFIEPQLLKIKEIRNRIAHHEAVLKNPKRLIESHTLCLNLIQYMSEEACSLIKDVDLFPSTSKSILFVIVDPKFSAF